jgi:2-polyprenyl-6-methoxyphenol hydroxylase-like FAD-dependent oxidoreductase
MSAASGRAIVLGGSLAGLLAARVLAEHADEVVIVERDRISDTTGLRRGVPQASHLHGLLRRGESIIERLLPGIADGLRDKGAVPVRFCADVRWYHHGNWKLQAGDSITATFMTRPFLEDEVRSRVLAYPGITLLEQHDAVALIAAPHPRRGISIRCRPVPEPDRQSDGSEHSAPSDVVRDPSGLTLTGDLIVDATGRGSRAVKWLHTLGCPQPPSSAVKIDVGYSSLFLHLADAAALGAKAMIVVPKPSDCTRAAALMPMEGDRWLCSAAGFVGDYPPKDYEGFLRFLADLPTEELHGVVRDAEPIGPITHARFAENRWIHFEKAKRMPPNFVVLGDAVGCFNPVYGQGMTAAALAADALDRALQTNESGPATDPATAARRTIAKAIKDVWRMSAGEDLGYPGVSGSRPPGYEIVRRYLERVHAATAVDPAALDGLLQVGHLLAPSTSLMRPRYALRVLTARTHARRDPHTADLARPPQNGTRPQ